VAGTESPPVTSAPLFARLIDDAGLFPPARRSMEEAVAAHASASAGLHAWIAGGFICPVSRLDELGRVLARQGEHGATHEVVAILDGALGGGVDGIAADAARLAARAGSGDSALRVVAVEAPLGTDHGTDPAGAVARHLGALELLDPEIRAFVEIPLGGEGPPSSDALAAIARARTRGERELGAKVRCGGLVATAFPTPASLAHFLATCAELGLPAKATAGLHHPFRRTAPGSGFREHGFVNLLAASGLAAAGTDLTTVTAVLEEEDAGAFALVDGSLSWRGSAIENPRGLLRGYGSCSFAEPVGDLIELGWIEGEIE
jgi:hypothetical protein